MKSSLLLGILVISILMLSFISTAHAVKYVGKDYQISQKAMGFWNRLRKSLSMFQFTMVNGKLCSTYPDEVKQIYSNESTQFEKYTCPSNVAGCAIDTWAYSTDCSTCTDSFPWKYLDLYKAQPGEEITYYNGQRIDVYYCNQDCSCSDYVSQGCGAGPCGANEMYRTRTCQDNCAEQEVCVAWAECSDSGGSGGGGSSNNDSGSSSGGGSTNDVPEIHATADPQISVSGNTITTMSSFRNDGASMSEPWILEQQVRPHGAGILSFVQPTLAVACDPKHPENVHKQFQIDAGDTVGIVLRSNNIAPGNYDVYLLSVYDCYPNNKKVQPYLTPYVFQNVRIGEGSGNSTQTCGDGICGNGESTSNCPADCSSNIMQWIQNHLFLVLLSTIGFVGIIILLFAMGEKNK